jgi:hypothetical protein
MLVLIGRNWHQFKRCGHSYGHSLQEGESGKADQVFLRQNTRGAFPFFPQRGAELVTSSTMVNRLTN